MTVSNMLLCPYNDFDDATLTCNVTLPTGFEVTNLQNTHRGDVLLIADTTTLIITGVWPEDRTINSLLLFHHLLHGANFRLQLFSDAGASSAVSGGDSTALPALCYTSDDPYTWSTGSNDPFRSEAPTWFYYDSDKTARSFKLTISGTPSTVSYFQIGRVFIGRSIHLARTLMDGASIGYADLSRSNRTEGGTRTSRQGETYRIAKGSLNGLGYEQLGVWMSVLRQAKTSRDIAVSFFVGAGGSLERWGTMNCYLSNLDAIGFQVPYLTKALQFEEA